MNNNIETIYDGMPIIEEDIKNMTSKELDEAWEEIIEKHSNKES